MAKQRSYFQEFSKGVIAENPTFVMVLGLCPTLAVTTSVKNGIAMGAAATAVLLGSNCIVSLVRSVIPDKVRIPCFIIIIASFVTMVELCLKAYFPPEVSAALGIFLPLIVVNCIILGRAEGFSSKHPVGRSLLDGLGMGVGFGLALTLVGTIREVLGSGTFLGVRVAESFKPAAVMIQAPGAFLTLGLLLAFFNWVRLRRKRSA